MVVILQVHACMAMGFKIFGPLIHFFKPFWPCNPFKHVSIENFHRLFMNKDLIFLVIGSWRYFCLILLLLDSCRQFQLLIKKRFSYLKKMNIAQGKNVSIITNLTIIILFLWINTVYSSQFSTTTFRKESKSTIP